MKETIIKFFISLFKLAPRYFFVIGIASCILLFANNNFLSRLGLKNFADNYRPLISIIAICSIGFIFVDFILFCWKKGIFILKKLKSSLTIKRYLRELTEKEKQILRFYIFQKTKTNSLRANDGVVVGLAQSGIIFLASSSGSVLNGHPYNIAPIAWKYLNKKPFLLEGTTQHQRNDRVKWR